MIDLFDRKERIALAVMAGILLLSLAAFFLVEFGERRGYERALSQSKALEKNFQPLDAQRNASKVEFLAWNSYHLHLKEISDGWFYSGEEAIKRLPLDVRKLIADAGMIAPNYKYNYHDVFGEKLKKVSVTFVFSGSYLELKKFLDEVERFPKFLMVEAIEFSKIYENVNRMDVKITLAGYYDR